MRLIKSIIAAVLATAITGAHAQAWPSKPIKVIVPYAAGGPTDVIARKLGVLLSSRLGQPIVIENKGGAGGVIGVDAVVKSPADGYTIGLVATGPVAGMPALGKVPYQQSDIEYITLAASSPAVIVVGSKSSYDSLASLIRAGKAAPNALNYGSAGNATTPHIGGALFAQEAGFEATHVPYKGTAPSITALMGGEIQFLSTDIMAVMGQVQAGALKMLAIASTQRASQAPDLPTTTELGLPQIQMETYYGLIGPKGLPADIQRRIRDATTEALASADMKQMLAQLGAAGRTSSGDEYRRLMLQEQQKWGRVAAKGNIRVD